MHSSIICTRCTLSYGNVDDAMAIDDPLPQKTHHLEYWNLGNPDAKNTVSQVWKSDKITYATRLWWEHLAVDANVLDSSIVTTNNKL